MVSSFCSRKGSYFVVPEACEGSEFRVFCLYWLGVLSEFLEARSVIYKVISLLAASFSSRDCNFDSKYFTKTIIFMEEEGVSCVLTLKFIAN